jgi:phosphate transport system substrate-binding protein
MKRYRTTLTVVIIFVLTLSVVAFAEEIKLGGGAPPIEKAITPVKSHFVNATGINLNTTAYGPKFAIMDLEKGAIDAAVLFLTLDEVFSLAKKENIEIKDPSLIVGSKVSEDRIVIIVNNSNPVSRLTKEQAKDILTGKIDNWKQVGGKDMPIIVVFGNLIKGVNELVSKKVMDGEKYAPDLLVVDKATDVINAVKSNPEAIGLASEGLMDGSVKPLEEPKVSVPVIIYTKGQPSAKVQKLIDFIKGEGQKYIK